MSYLPVVLLVVALGALAQGLALWSLAPWLRRAVARIEPAARVRWLLALLASPLAAGAFLLALLFGHCLVSLRPGAGLDDGCASLCDLCLWHAPPASLAAAALALLCVAPLLARVARAAAALRASRRAVARLDGIASPRDGGARTIPGTLSFVAGWPRAYAYVGDGIARQLGPEADRAVAAHEAAHVSRGDVGLRLAGRVLAGAHLPWVAAPLVAALDLAIEQACDAEASRVVDDPLVVAEAILGVARLDPGPLAGAMGFSDDALDERVAALCDGAWARPTAAARACAALAAAAGAAGVAMYEPLHHAGEALFALLRG